MYSYVQVPNRGLTLLEDRQIRALVLQLQCLKQQHSWPTSISHEHNLVLINSTYIIYYSLPYLQSLTSGIQFHENILLSCQKWLPYNFPDNQTLNFSPFTQPGCYLLFKLIAKFSQDSQVNHIKCTAFLSFEFSTSLTCHTSFHDEQKLAFNHLHTASTLQHPTQSIVQQRTPTAFNTQCSQSITSMLYILLHSRQTSVEQERCCSKHLHSRGFNEFLDGIVSFCVTNIHHKESSPSTFILSSPAV